MNTPTHGRRSATWPLLVLALPAFVAIWSGWIGLGTLTGFGVVQPLPGLWDGLRIDSRVTLPIGMEAYAAYALRVWLSGTSTAQARSFARRSTIAALVLGAAGQVAYHLMSAAGVTRAPWPMTALVACLPVAVLGMGAALAHLLHATPITPTTTGIVSSSPTPSKELNQQAHAEHLPAHRPTPLAAATAATNAADAVRALAVEHPDWTQAALAERAGCSVRTVRRHLNSPTNEPAASTDTNTDSEDSDTDSESEAAA